MKTSDLNPCGCASVFKTYSKKHEELETISVSLFKRSATNEKEIVLSIFFNINLRSVTIGNMGNTGDIIGRRPLPNAFQNLEKLILTPWHRLLDQGLNWDTKQ